MFSDLTFFSISLMTIPNWSGKVSNLLLTSLAVPTQDPKSVFSSVLNSPIPLAIESVISLVDSVFSSLNSSTVVSRELRVGFNSSDMASPSLAKAALNISAACFCCSFITCNSSCLFRASSCSFVGSNFLSKLS